MIGEGTMPRKEIELPYKIEHLSILDEQGNLDKELEPNIPEETLLKMYRTMVLGRRFDERMLIMQRQGRIGTFAPIRGQEAQVGAVAALEPEDWLVPSFREMPSEVYLGKPLESALMMYGGFNEGAHMPEDLNILPISIPVGSQMLHAVGIGYAMRYRRESKVVMTFFGDGATSEGDFHEAMNFAAVLQAPVIFMCQNNHWAISVPRSKQSRSETLAQKAIAYGMPGMQVDGNDVLAVFSAAKEAIDQARNGKGPSMIELLTYRMGVHTTADDPKKYRPQEEVEEWEKRDPITRFAKYLSDRGLLDEEKSKGIEEDARAEIKKAEERWREFADRKVDPLVMFDHLYAELPPYVARQREELARELGAGETEDKPVRRT